MPVEKTEAEIKAVIRRYGATSFASFEEVGRALIAFEMQGRRILFALPLPSRGDKEFTTYKRGYSEYKRTENAAISAWEQACRSRWRALFLCIKAKLESVESGIETFEDAFLAHIQMPDGKTVSEHVKPRIASAYETGSMQPLLPAPRDGT
ncbi:MAG: hypothetical protein KDJ90_00580 [Nitratireductor sp.]|nr:hypothetical protein [Nitratireductor sp.]